ncbi:MAG: radical SAM protein [Elusimicrobiota bacterium]
MHIKFLNVVGDDFSAMDIGITHLATYINERTNARHRATITDFTFHKKNWKEHLHESYKKDKPDIIGISTNTMYMQFVRPVMTEIKKNYCTPIILGGAQASIHPKETLSIPEADAVCIGDGEFAITKFLDAYSAGKSVKGIDGIWAKEACGYVVNPGGCFIENIDQFPYPDWDLWEDLERHFYFIGMLYIQGSRGCPYKCTYCDAHGIKEAVGGKYFRLRDPVAFAQEIHFQWNKYKDRKTPPRLAQLFDPVFTFDKKWLEKFCLEYKSLGMADKFRYSAFSRIDNLDEEKIRLLSDSGCALLRVGVESGNEFIRNEVFKKKITNEKVREIFHLCKKHNIKHTAFYILGGPGETCKTISETIRFAVELDAARSAFFIYKPFTAEGLKQIHEHGGQIDPVLWSAADNITFGAVVRLKDLSPKQVEWYQKKAYFLTFSRRLLRMIGRLWLKYFLRLAIYLARGIYYGLDVKYLLIYYHIYSYDNVDK